MWIVLCVSLMFNLVLYGSNLYKLHVIEDYETRLPRIYQDFISACIELKGYLDLEERASREPKLRKELNNLIDKYSGYVRRINNDKT